MNWSILPDITNTKLFMFYSAIPVSVATISTTYNINTIIYMYIHSLSVNGINLLNNVLLYGY